MNAGAGAGDGVVVRRFRAERDAPGLRACFIALQDHEHAIDARAPAGAAIADEYLAWMFDRCARYRGEVWIAEAGGRPIGFATLLLEVPRSDPDDPLPVHALLSELAVDEAWRRRGIGRCLLAKAEERVRDAGAAELRIGVFGANHDARRFYARAGYEELHVLLRKRHA